MLLAILAASIALAYLISLAIFPWRPCRHCGGRGKLPDPVFTYAHRDCPRCNGKGRGQRFGRRIIFRGKP